jgi:hypothetical protein
MEIDKRLLLAWRVLSLLIPRHALERGRDLAKRYRYDYEFRDYIASRIWLLIPTGFVFVLVSTVCAIGTVVFIRGYVRPPAPFLGFAVFLLGIAVWLAGIASQLLVFLSWLEFRAAPHLAPPARKAPPRSGSFDRKAAAELLRDLPSRISHKSLALWAPVGVFVLVPLGVVAVTSPAAVMFLVVIVLLAPILYILFDR